MAAPHTEYDHPAVMRIINDPDIWNVSTSTSFFTFVNLIKGFVPAALSYDVHALVSIKALTSSIVNSFLQIIFEKVRQDIWLPWCHQVIQREKHLNISQKQKVIIKDHNTTFLKWSCHVLNSIINAALHDPNLWTSFSLAQASISNGLHFNMFLCGSRLHICCH